MDAQFWHQRWENSEIAFHERVANPLLVKYCHALSLSRGNRVFVPLCGKSLDIGWLLSQGYKVAGAELSELAITQLFEQLGTDPKVTDLGEVKHYSALQIDMFVGDIFALTRELLGPVDAIYDRAALVALPEDMRGRYSRHLTEITVNAQQLLITFEYDQELMNGPPFSINEAEVNRQYIDRYQPTLLASSEVKGGLKGVCAAKEHVWLLDSGRA